jgi:N-acetylglucosaminyl-diphospho-decaprenol L-rhamnosyltransferase
VLIRAAALRRAGLFDEGYFMYYEDLDLCIRFQKAGYRLRYLPHPTVLHRVAGSSTSAQRQYHTARSGVRFYAVHGRRRYWLFIPYRLGSGLRSLMRFMMQGHPDVARAYLRGIRDGLRDRARGGIPNTEPI